MNTPLNPRCLVVAGFATAAALQAAPAAAANCYALYSPANKIVYQSSEPPVDLSDSIAEAVRAQYPGHHLVVSTSPSCPRLDERPESQRAAMPVEGAGRSPAVSPANRISSVLNPSPIPETGVSSRAPSAAADSTAGPPANRKPAAAKPRRRASGPAN